MLLLNDLQALHWAAGGAALGAITLLLLGVTNRVLGISTSFENLCALGSRLPYFSREELRGPGRWRMPFILGLVAGGVLSASIGGGWSPFWDLGRFDTVIGLGPAGKLVWMFVGGLFIGFGTRLAGGCTSGHGIFGLSNFERGSLVSTLAYMGAGAVTTHLIYRFLFVA